MSDGASHITLDRANLLRLVAAVREGYASAIPEVTTELEHGFVLGWKAAADAFAMVAESMPDLYGDEGCPVVEEDLG